MIDIHAHLCFHEFDRDRDDIVRKCTESMKAVIASSARYDEGLCVLNLAERYRGFIYPTLGYHPTEGDRPEDVLKLIRENRHAVAGIGETGMDFHWEKDPAKRERQRQVFREFIALAAELKKPLVLHTWDAEDECFAEVKAFDGDVIFHCFSGTRELAERIVERGFYVSFSTQILFSKHHKKLAKAVPLESMTLETDAPFLSPNKPERNYPWNIRLSAGKIAGMKGVSAESVLEKTTANAARVFGINI